jgi:hypothetical protein
MVVNNMITQIDLEKSCEFYESIGLLDTAAEVAKRMGDLDRANRLYDRAIQDYVKLGRTDIAIELKERKENPTSSYLVLDDFLQ